MPPVIDVAKAYASSGWFVFPLRKGTKAPFKGFPWKDESTNDINRINAFSRAYPESNWAVDCEKSGLLIVDVDQTNKKEGEKTLAQIDIIKDTFTVKTPHGRHLYYAGHGKTGVNTLGNGVDTRGIGGYALIPGSEVENRFYTVANNASIQPVPKKISLLLSRPSKKKIPQQLFSSGLDQSHNVTVAIEYLKNTAPVAYQGARDSTCYKVACRVRDYGISLEKAQQLMEEYYSDKVEFSNDFGPSQMDWKVRSAYKYAQSPLGNSALEVIFPQAKEVLQDSSFKHRADKIKQRDLRPRAWVMKDRLLRGYMTLTVAPGGVGKSLFNILEGMSIATGKSLTHNEVKETGNVWYYNTEDSLEELNLRIDAARKYYQMDGSELNRFFYSSGYSTPLKLAGLDERGRPLVYENVVQWVIEEIVKDDIVLMVIDPLVEIHGMNENSNAEMSILMQTLRRIAEKTRCALSLVHHTSKSKDGGAGNTEKSRGASAIHNSCRIVHTLYPMTISEAKKYGISLERHWWHVRMDSAKMNLSRPDAYLHWYRKISVENVPGESTGTLEPVVLEQPHYIDEKSTIQNAVKEIVKPGKSMSIYRAAQQLINEKKIDGTISTARRLVYRSMVEGMIGDGCVWKLSKIPGRNSYLIICNNVTTNEEQ
jgi:RecA-family ATPase